MQCACAYTLPAGEAKGQTSQAQFRTKIGAADVLEKTLGVSESSKAGAEDKSHATNADTNGKSGC